MAARASLKQWICVLRELRFFLPILSEGRPVLLKLNTRGPYSSFERKIKFRRSLFRSSIKREIRHFHVAVVHVRSWCCCFFWRSRRRRRRVVRSLSPYCKDGDANAANSKLGNGVRKRTARCLTVIHPSLDLIESHWPFESLLERKCVWERSVHVVVGCRLRSASDVVCSKLPTCYACFVHVCKPLAMTDI